MQETGLLGFQKYTRMFVRIWTLGGIALPLVLTKQVHGRSLMYRLLDIKRRSRDRSPAAFADDQVRAAWSDQMSMPV